MTEKADHKANRCEVYVPDTAAVVGQVSEMPPWRRDLNARVDTAKTISVNKDLIEDNFALWRGACFADRSGEMGTFVRLVNSGEKYD